MIGPGARLDVRPGLRRVLSLRDDVGDGVRGSGAGERGGVERIFFSQNHTPSPFMSTSMAEASIVGASIAEVSIADITMGSSASPRSGHLDGVEPVAFPSRVEAREVRIGTVAFGAHGGSGIRASAGAVEGVVVKQGRVLTIRRAAPRGIRPREEPLERFHLLQKGGALAIRHHHAGVGLASATGGELRQLQLLAQVLRRGDGEGNDARLQRLEFAREKTELVAGVGADATESRESTSPFDGFTEPRPRPRAPSGFAGWEEAKEDGASAAARPESLSLPGDRLTGFTTAPP